MKKVLILSIIFVLLLIAFIIVTHDISLLSISTKKYDIHYPIVWGCRFDNDSNKLILHDRFDIPYTKIKILDFNNADLSQTNLDDYDAYAEAIMNRYKKITTSLGKEAFKGHELLIFKGIINNKDYFGHELKDSQFLSYGIIYFNDERLKAIYTYKTEEQREEIQAILNTIKFKE